MRALIIDRSTSPGAISTPRPRAVGYWQSRVVCRTLAVQRSGAAAEWSVRGSVQAPMLYLDVPPGSHYRIGRQIWTAPAAGVAFLPGNTEFSRHSPPGRFLAVRLDLAGLQAEWCSREQAVQPSAGLLWLATKPQEIHGLVQATRLVVEAADPATDPRQQGLAEARLVSALVDALQRVQIPAPAARPGRATAARLAALEAWIDAHLAEPLTLGALCAQAGLGARTLQKGFEARRGMSPMRFVTERRLALARDRLSHATPADTVTMVALDCGFEHMSRFAQAYRQVYGEPPSQTLARRLDACAAGRRLRGTDSQSAWQPLALGSPQPDLVSAPVPTPAAARAGV